VHWGTALADRWLLPHFVVADMRDVVDELKAFGYPFASEWFDLRRVPLPALRLGRLRRRPLLRQAIEPWHVLGEEVAGTGTARYVDFRWSDCRSRYAA
jgi:uncharacterized protein (DUF2126 family)